MMNAPVAGASGFIGSQMVRRLLASNSVTSLVRRPETAIPGSKVVAGDLTEPATLKFDGAYDVVYHFAALTPIERNKDKLAKVNYEGTENLIDSVRDRTKSFVYASGLAVFDPGVEGGIVSESTPVNPDTEFVKMRIEAERYLQEQCKDRGIDFTVVLLWRHCLLKRRLFQVDVHRQPKERQIQDPGKRRILQELCAH